MSIRRRLGRLEQRLQAPYGVLVLPDGSSIRFTGEDAFDALVAVLTNESHWLLPSLRQAVPESDYARIMQVLEGGADVS